MNTPYVDESSAAKARSMEEKLSIISAEAGIIFVGVTAVPAINGKSYLFEITLGVSKYPSAAKSLALTILADREVSRENISIRAFKGIPGKCHTIDSPKRN